MHSKDRLNRELLKQPVLDHLPSSPSALFGRLEYQVRGAIEITLGRQILRRRQQHGGMPIMPTGMHLSRVLAGMAEGVELLHGKGIHIGPQRNCTPGSTRLDDAHNTCGSKAPMNGNAPLRQLCSDHVGCTHFVETQFGMRMQVTPEGGNIRSVGNKGFNHVHAAIMAL